MSEVITAINAKPETVKDFLGNYEYTIPDYQRPYSWGKDECVRLWEDILSYYEERNGNLNSPYFLGNVVIYNEDKQRFVVDGQQRLITLNLLIRALFSLCQDFTALESTLYKLNPITNKVIKPYEIRLTHNVLGNNENLKLKQVLLDQNGESNYQENYDLFLEKINDFFNSNNYSADDKHQFILSLIGNVVLLPIECTNFDSALTIFETINNRGMDLNDSDIFKSKLYKFSGDDNNEFIIRWNDLVQEVEKNDIELKDIFSNYMHVLRGKEGNVDSIVGLRKFYDQENGSRLKNWKDVLNSLDKIVWAWNYLTDKKSDKASTEILNWSTTLQRYPNSYWEYPIITFLHENIIKEGEDFKFNSEEELLKLMKSTVRYCYWKWLKYRGVGAIKDTIFKVVREIVQKGDYNKIYQNDINEDFNNQGDRGFQNSLRNILDKDLGKGLKGICLLSVLLNKDQRRLIPDNYHIEHILPQKWEHYKYSGWNESTYTQYSNKLGNLVILEAKLNIKSSHRFYVEKKGYYSQSEIADVRALGELNDWTPKEFKERNQAIIERLLDFFKNQ